MPRVLPIYFRLYIANIANLSRTRGEGDYCDYPPEAIRNMLHVSDISVRSLGDFDFLPVLHSLATPSLIIEGEKTNVPLDATEAWARALPDSRLLLVPDAGHMNWVDQPEFVIACIDEFLRGKWPSKARSLSTHPQ